MDTYCRKIVGWSIDNVQNAQLVVNALDMAIRARRPFATIVHADHGTQFTSWAFTERIRANGRDCRRSVRSATGWTTR